MDQEYKNYVDNAPEYKIFFMIEEAAAFISNMGILFVQNKIRPQDFERIKKDIDEVSERQNYLMNLVKKFGVKELYLVEGDKKYSSVEYRQWFNHWDKWKKGLPNSDWETVKTKLAKDESFNELLPTTKWND